MNRDTLPIIGITLAFFAIALGAAMAGFWLVGGVAATFAKVLFAVFLSLFLLSLQLPHLPRR